MSLVIPVYNEEEIIEQCINYSLKILSKYFIDYEMIIIDDGSTDHTPKIIKHISKSYPQLIILTNDRNIGIGRSVLRGLKFASKDFIIHNGADSPFNLDNLGKLHSYLNNYDIIVIVRNNHTGYTPYRRVVSFINKSLLRILFPLKLNDYNFVQIYRKEVIDKIKPSARSAGFLMPEILFRAYGMGYKIHEVSLDYQARTTGKATAGRISVLVHSLSDMLKFFIKQKIRN